MWGRCTGSGVSSLWGRAVMITWKSLAIASSVVFPVRMLGCEGASEQEFTDSRMSMLSRGRSITPAPRRLRQEHPDSLVYTVRLSVVEHLPSTNKTLTPVPCSTRRERKVSVPSLLSPFLSHSPILWLNSFER